MSIRVGRFARFFIFTLVHCSMGSWANIKPCKTTYKTKNQNSLKHVAYQNDRIEMLIMNLRTIFKNIAPSSNTISLNT